MIRPATLTPRPSVLLGATGGLVGMILLSAVLFLAPALGVPAVDLPVLIGGVFTGAPEAAAWLGFWLFFLLGWLVLAPLLVAAWPILPGGDEGPAGALVKGAAWGLGLWLLAGLMLPVLGALNRIGVAELARPGLFALDAGLAAAAVLLVAHLAYGAATALVAATSRNISPLDSVGWQGYRGGAAE